MKLKASTGRKLRYGGTSAAITALIIAAIIIFNVIFSLLTERFRWYVDLTPDLHFTISDECYQLIEESDIEDDEELPMRFGVRNIPTILFIKNGEVVDKQVGACTKAVLEEKLKSIL
jgi:thioredoxin-like negative regulator of GroEL